MNKEWDFEEELRLAVIFSLIFNQIESWSYLEIKNHEIYNWGYLLNFNSLIRVGKPFFVIKHPSPFSLIFFISISNSNTIKGRKKKASSAFLYLPQFSPILNYHQRKILAAVIQALKKLSIAEELKSCHELRKFQ